MRNLLLTCLILSLFVLPTFADETSQPNWDNPTSYKERVYPHTHSADIIDPGKSDDDIVLGLKADAPNLVRLSELWTLGLEGGKDMDHTNLDEGWFAFAKVTFSGSLLDFSGK